MENNRNIPTSFTDGIKAFMKRLSVYMKSHKKLMCILLASILAFTSVFGVFTLITKGEKVDCEKEAEKYNEAKSDASAIYMDASKNTLSAEITRLDGVLSKIIGEIKLEALLYSDAGASLVGKIIGEGSGKKLTDVSFTSLKKSFPEAYRTLTRMQQSSASWEHIDVIPFGIKSGDKKAFIEACGDFTAFFGNEAISMALKAPSLYDDALLPVIESLHIEPMPTLVGFLLESGLDASKRMEVLIENLLSVIDPIKKAPITYICTMLPDFIVNYRKAVAFINEKELGPELPSIEEVLDSVWKIPDLEYMPLDLDYIVGLGTARVTESSSFYKERVEINGDRDSIFLYICYYIAEHLTYKENYPIFERFLTNTFKTVKRDSEAGKIIYGDLVSEAIAIFVNIFALNKAKQTDIDVSAYVEQHNKNADFSYVFSEFMTENRVSEIINYLDSLLSGYLKNGKIEKLLFNDTVATVFIKFMNEFCDIAFADIPFEKMKTSFPEAYNYLLTHKRNGKSWHTLETIPFGITPGDKEAFLSACGAGTEYFGDILALDIVISPTTYDEALVTITESFHVGVAPDIEQFIKLHGVDGAKRVEIVLDMLLRMLEPFKEAPVSYLCTILPDLIYSYNIAVKCCEANPKMAYTGFTLPPVRKLLEKIVDGTGIIIPDYDFDSVIPLSTAAVAESGDRTGERVELTGDKEAVFTVLYDFVMQVLSTDGNMESITGVVSGIFGISPVIIRTLLATFKSFSAS